MFRRAALLVRIFAAFAAILVMAVVLAVWRLSIGPINVTFLTPTIEKIVDHYLPDTHTQINHTIFDWDNIEHVFALSASDVVIKDDANNIIATVPQSRVSISALGLLTGRLLPLEFLIEKPELSLSRQTDGHWQFGGVAMNSPSTGNDDHSLHKSLQTIFHDLAQASHTRLLRITAAQIAIHDEKMRTEWRVAAPEMRIERTAKELSGNAHIEVVAQDKTSSVDINYSYDAEKLTHDFEIKLADFTPALFAGSDGGADNPSPLSAIDLPVSGNGVFSFDRELELQIADAAMKGGEGHLNVPTMWDAPLPLKKAEVQAHFDKTKPEANLLTTQFDMNGAKLGASVKAVPATTAGRDVDFDLAVTIDNWPMDRFGQLWPKTLIPHPREWIMASLSKGNFDHGEAGFKGYFSWEHLADAVVAEGSGKITASNARVNYLEGMPAVDGVNAVATFNLQKMSVDISGGGIGGLRIVPFTLEMEGLDTDLQTIYIPLKISGPIPDVLKVIGVPRLGYTQKLGVEPEDIGGMAKGTVEFRFPLLKSLEMNGVDIKAQADLTGVATAHLIKKILIMEGNVALNLDKTGMDIKGTTLLNKIPSQVNWHENFDSKNGKPARQGNIKAIVGDEQWRSLSIDALKGTRGIVQVVLDVVQPSNGITNLNGQFDMTAAEIHVDQINWKKPINRPAFLKISAQMADGKNIQIKSIDLSGTDSKASGSATLSAKGDELLDLTLSPLRIGRTNASLKYQQKDDDEKTLFLQAEGDSLDISGLKGGNDVASKDPRPKEYHIEIGRLYTSENGFIGSAQGYAVRDAQGWRAINLRGLAGAKYPMTIDLGMRDGRRVFNASCDNFGEAVKALGMTDTVSDGRIRITGQSNFQDTRTIEGSVKISHFVVKNLPALVVLLNATSPFGFKNLLSGNMDFDRLNGNFKWYGDTIEVQNVRLPGPAVGMDVAGKVDMNGGTANLHGVVTPFSMVSNIIGAIPLIGDVLTGGDGGGVLAVAYTITGNLNDPKVSVNPASLLTPGFLRNLFFSGSDEVDDEPSSAAIQPAPEPLPPAKHNFNQR